MEQKQLNKNTLAVIKMQAALLVMTLAFMGCSGSNSIGKRIDFIAGHPGDPDLPKNVLGATDVVLEASDPIALHDLLSEGLSYAHRKAKKRPRYLFALGRIAQVLAYDDLADSCFTVAAENGSGAAHAYLGFRDFYDNEDVEAAVSRFEIAIAGGFVDPELEKAYEACNFDPETYGFNRADIMSAFYYRDWSRIDTLNQKSVGYRNSYERYLARFTSTLWNSEILYFTDDKSLLLDLDHQVQVFLDRSISKYLYMSTIYRMDAHIIQDAIRYAGLYDENPVAFRKIQDGIVEYFQYIKYK